MNILFVDDHSIIIESYIMLLEREISSFTAFKALNCEEAFRFITTVPTLDLAILDYQLPEYDGKGLSSGMDIALLLKKHHPKCKIFIITAYEEASTIYTIHKKVQPDALITKNDVSQDTFTELFKADKRYLSSTVQKAVRNITNHHTLLNDVNREILLHLKQGFKVNELDQYLSLSTSGIQKRITKMKQVFNVSDTQGLIREAIKQKII